jgi:hypothetical protein
MSPSKPFHPISFQRTFTLSVENKNYFHL